MPLQRYLLVEGKLDAKGVGIPVSDPRTGILQTGAQARFLGWKPKANPPKDIDFLIELFEPVQQVVLDHNDTRAAIKVGDLTMHGECAARSFDEAAQKLKAQPTHSAPKVIKKGGEA